jgi:6-phospho-beta-glucosidase
MRELAPGALLVNFTNPAGLVTEALSRYATDVPSVGVCNVPITTKMNILKRLDEQGIHAEPDHAELNTLGLNHLTWHRGFKIDGEEMWGQVMKNFTDDIRSGKNHEWDLNTIESLNMMPNYYLSYFYYTDRKIAEQTFPPSRADKVMEIEQKLFAQYAEPDRSTPPEGLMQRGGAYYSTVATQLLNAHHNDLNETHVVNVPHNGAIAGWPADWVLEIPSKVGRSGIVPIPGEPLPHSAFGLLSQIKAYELLTVEAAVHGDRNAAYQALLTHPLGPSADKVGVVLDDLLTTHKQYLPQFWS